MKRQLNVWLDINHNGEWCIECDDPEITCDGHIICVFPWRVCETNSDGSESRAKIVLSYMRGERQVSRRGRP